MRSPNTKPALSVQEFADANGISLSTAWKVVHRGEVESYRVGNQVRITVEAAKRFQNPGEDFSATIKRIVDRAPKLTAAQKALLAPLLADGDDEPVEPAKRGRRGA
jgi:excisionase family DNA binding protein